MFKYINAVILVIFNLVSYRKLTGGCRKFKLPIISLIKPVLQWAVVWAGSLRGGGGGGRREGE